MLEAIINRSPGLEPGFPHLGVGYCNHHCKWNVWEFLAPSPQWYNHHDVNFQKLFCGKLMLAPLSSDCSSDLFFQEQSGQRGLLPFAQVSLL
jgi:hypothetical protein